MCSSSTLQNPKSNDSNSLDNYLFITHSNLIKNIVWIISHFSSPLSPRDTRQHKPLPLHVSAAVNSSSHTIVVVNLFPP